MGSLSTTEQRKLAYFHSLAKVMTENVTQEVYESRYKSSHNIRLSEIWSDTIYSAATFTDAQTQSLTNSAITLHENVTLTQIPGSNGMAWYYNSGGTFMRPWISPVDVPNTITNLPSNGFEVKLYTSTGTQIGTTQGAWAIDYYAGIIHFGQGYTPSDLGWGNIKCTFFQYSGRFGASGGTSTDAFVTAGFDTGRTMLVFNSGETNMVEVNLEYLNKTGITTVEFDSGTSMMYFDRYLSHPIAIDLISLKGGGSGGGSGQLSISNTNMVANNTSSGSTLACGIGLLSRPVTGSTMAVFINGVKVNVGDLSTDDCYFSGDGGITPRALGQEHLSDLLYWRYVGDIAYIGYNLSTNDRLTFMYLMIS